MSGSYEEYKRALNEALRPITEYLAEDGDPECVNCGREVAWTPVTQHPDGGWWHHTDFLDLGDHGTWCDDDQETEAEVLMV